MTARNYDVLETETEGVPVKHWTRGVVFESVAREQVARLATMKFMFKHVAIMPDVHWGRGATVGSVIATRGAIIPAAVGVDLGCGMMAVETNLRASDLPDNLFAVRSAIEAAVPHGRTDNGGPNDRGAWGDVPPGPLAAWTELDERFEKICEKHPPIAQSNSRRHLGTLGTGNHFIEICIDERDIVWDIISGALTDLGDVTTEPVRGVGEVCGELRELRRQTAAVEAEAYNRAAIEADRWLRRDGFEQVAAVVADRIRALRPTRGGTPP